ncbi:MAG: hypothetical protein EOO13_01700, partial [Chitinophagaceae bacterium]
MYCNIKKISTIIVVTFFSMFISTYSLAGTDPTVTKPIQGSLNQFVVNAESYVKDLKYFTLSSTNRNAIQNNSILNMVGVGIEEQSSFYIRSNFSATVVLEITTYDNTETANGTYNKTFTVTYDTAAGAKYKSLDYTTFNNAFALKAKIVSIDSGTVNWPVSKVLKVENQLTASRDYPFNCQLAIDGLNTTLSVTNKELTAGWTPAPLDNNAGITEYDFEWSWIDEGSMDRYKNGNNFVHDLIFDNNATRVTITGSSYNIPLLYDDTGRIFIRVRAVQMKTDGQRIEGKWNWISNDPTQPGISSNPVFYQFYGHEELLNWQASTSFAEEGKRKSVVQYFDGSLRNRQTVTKDNTSNTTVVAESFYDYQGRAVLQVLPAPTLSNAISYAKNFNQAIGYNEYPKSVYDKLDAGATVCTNPAKPFNTDFGTANYYSAKNPLLATDPKAKYIPDATISTLPNEAYAFTETRLAPDGRIAAQGGVGISHQLGSGHETKYYYETPAQTELDALFGTDAGEASHYFKNLVKDANGQYSVSYVDMHGRTIATALAGDAPTKAGSSTAMLEELDSKTDRLFTRQLIDKETNIINGNSIVSSKPIVVLRDNSNYAFDYSLTPKQLNLISCSDNQPACFDCLYQLKFTITADCDNQVIYADSMINFTLGQYIQQCNTATGNANQGFVKHFEKVLNEGSYTVTKTLTLSSEAQAAYRNKFLQTDTCKKLVDFYTQELALLQATANCNITCESCKASLGNDLTGFISKFAIEMNVTVASLSPQTIAQLTSSYNEAMANCDRLCNNTDGLDLIRSTRSIMLQDMTPPHGQYARTDVESQNRTYNIFKTDDISNNYSGYGIASFWPDYKQPRKFNANDVTIFPADPNKYYNEFDEIATVNQSLLTLSAGNFVDSFRTNWANQLLVHHPEFKKLQFSENQLKTTYQFEADLEKDTTWNQAMTHGYITSLVDLDPFFNGVADPGYKQKMKFGNHLDENQPAPGVNLDINPVIHGIEKYAKLRTADNCPGGSIYANAYPTMWQIALATVFCRDKANGLDCVIDYSDPNTKPGCTMNSNYAQPGNGFNEGCPTDRDWAWKTFKTLYLLERRKLISAYLNQNAPSFLSGNSPSLYVDQTPNQERFINHANPKVAIGNLSSPDAGTITAIINTASTNMTQGHTQALALAQQQYDTVCRGYVPLWLNQLRSCPQLSSRLNNEATWVQDSTWLMTRLVAICRNGSDNGHPFGSSSVQPGNAVTIAGDPTVYTNFTDVVKRFMDDNLVAGGIPNPTAECYSWLINTPKPYEKQKAVANSYVVTKPSDCECQRITSLQTEWQQSSTYFTGTFSAYLQYKHGTFISNEQLDALLALCNGSYACRMLSKPISLPPALQCPPANVPPPATCISCNDYTTIKSQFITLTQQTLIPYAAPANETEVNYNIAFAAYINNSTGFSKTWQEYLAFQNTCDADNPAISCGSLDSTLQAFYASPQYLANPTGIACVQAFVNFFNSYHNVVYTYAQWMAMFSSCSIAPNVCKPAITCEVFTDLIDGFYNFHGVQVYKNGNCQALFVSYVNSKLQSTYTFAQLQAIYEYTCGYTICDQNLPVCDFPNTFLLNKAYRQFLLNNPQPWTLADCKQSFVDFFNNYFGISPAWDAEAIGFLYPEQTRDRCTPALSQICSPPYTCAQLQIIKNDFLAYYTTPGVSVAVCQADFAAFFNQRMGTSYTYTEIRKFYLSICGENLFKCAAFTNCQSIIAFIETYIQQPPNDFLNCHQAFLNSFNATFSTNYTNWNDLAALYAACNYDLNSICSPVTLIADCHALNAFVNNFKTSYPDPATQLGNQCQSYFAALFNQHFHTNLSYAQIETYYLQQCGTALNVCATKCPQINDFIAAFDSTYSGLLLSEQARKDLFVFEYNKLFLHGASSDGSQLIESSVDSLIVENASNPTDPRTFNPVSGFEKIKLAILTCSFTSIPSFAPTTPVTQYSPQVLLNLKKVYAIMHPNGFPNDCQADFSSWFNSVMHTQYNYTGLMALYNNVVGAGAGIICGGLATEFESPRIYVDVIPLSDTLINLPPMLCGLNDPGSGPVPIEHEPCKDIPQIAFHFAQEHYELYLDSLRDVFDEAYRKKCLAAGELESFTVTYTSSEYHYTLYYYDQAGNLVKTVPPSGIRRLTGNNLDSVKIYRANVLNGQPEANNKKTPLHTLATQYRYNTLNQVIAQTTPDGGTSRFYYDRLGRLVVSRNSKQSAEGKFSYTLYDLLGRIS